MTSIESTRPVSRHRKSQTDSGAKVSAPTVSTEEVRRFWDSNPLCAQAIPFPLGSREYFEYYDRLREGIESVEFSHNLHEYRNFAGKKVLDVGSGNGYVLANYARNGGEVYGVDVTPTAVGLCRKRFEYAGLTGDFRVGDAQHLDFADDSFDCACSMGVLHHVPDTARAVAEIYRVLKPGGRLIVMFYHRDSAQYRINFPIASRLRGKSVRQLVNEFDGVGNPKGDVYSREELAQLLRSFEDIDMSVGFLTGPMVLPRGGRFVPTRLLRPFAGRWGWNLYAKAHKPRAGV